MNSFPTPASYVDQYNDSTRPDGFRAPMLTDGVSVQYIWSSSYQQWSRFNQTQSPVIQLSAPSPGTSPTFMSTTPGSTSYKLGTVGFQGA
jgi:hypothetical protein